MGKLLGEVIFLFEGIHWEMLRGVGKKFLGKKNTQRGGPFLGRGENLLGRVRDSIFLDAPQGTTLCVAVSHKSTGKISKFTGRERKFTGEGF